MHLNLLDILLKYSIPMIAAEGLNFAPEIEKARGGLSAIVTILLIPVVIVLFFILRYIYRNTIGKKLKTTIIEDYQKEATDLVRSGSYVSAANVYEHKLKDLQKAAVLYEKGGDHRKAAELYDILGENVKAKEMYEKDSNIESSAEVSMREGNYEEAAKLYDKAGKKIDAAILMEKTGKKLAATRLYREAGDYRNAARLLGAEGMLKEAAEMFGLSLRGKTLDSSTIEDFYDYAYKLEKAGETDKALEVYREINRTNPTYQDVDSRIHALSPSAEKEGIEKVEPIDEKITVRSFIKNRSMDPKNSLKLWLHILSNLQDAYKAGRPCGMLSPENISVDSNNNITFLNEEPSSEYIAPEKLKGLEADAQSDIYSMGVILYEMLTGSLDDFGTQRVANLVSDLPEWLDEMVIRCIRKVREDRYLSIEEIFTDIKNLSKSRATDD